MSSIIQPTNLTVKIQETCKINNLDRNGLRLIIMTNVKEINTRIMSIATSVTTIADFDATGQGKFTAANVKYIRMTNLDDTNYVDITASDHVTASSAGQLFSIRLQPGKTFMLGSAAFNAATSDANNSIAASDTIQQITGIANTAACDIDIYIATI